MTRKLAISNRIAVYLPIDARVDVDQLQTQDITEQSQIVSDAFPMFLPSRKKASTQYGESWYNTSGSFRNRVLLKLTRQTPLRLWRLQEMECARIFQSCFDMQLRD
ncbi:MAG: hypothetical protein HYS65_04655 [Betaproteobacteria bacterium]|nr:hypothetical protein [Betaproteobacteria bacterium]MBI2293649.1 hypothetical protein [Betaproteobacteria bacterium]MBI3057445.1 hypothetical protein [Betaproteobacteria bacterium]